MNIFRRIVVSSSTRFLALCFACLCLLMPAELRAQLGAPRATFFAPARESGKDLAPDLLYPQGRRFPFTCFSVAGNIYVSGNPSEPLPEERKQAVFERYKRDGFSAIGPQYELNDRILDDAAALGMPALFTILGGPEDDADWSLKDLSANKADREQIATSIRQRVEQALKHKNERYIGWWYLQPEELRHWRPGEILYLEVAAETIRQTDPRRRPVWMYDPGHRTAGALKHTAKHLDILGKGMYTNYSGQVNDRVWCRWTIEQQNEAIKDANPAAVSIAVPEMFRHPGRFVEKYGEDETSALPLIREWVRHDVYAALVAGARGVAVFSMRERVVPEGKDGLPFTGAIYEAHYSAYAEIAGELNGARALGELFLFGEWRDDVKVEVVDGPKTVTLKYRNNEPVVYPSISHATIAKGRDRTIILVNSTTDRVSAMITGLPYGDDITVRDLFTGNTFALGEGEIECAFTAHEVKAYRIEQPQ